MKANKLFRKLALSGVALGAAAVTLTATTFAWYTSNTEADVTAVSGKTEAKGSDSLFIAPALTYTAASGYQAASWGDYVATADPILTAGSDATITLKPVYSGVSSSTRTYTEISSVTAASQGAPKDVVSYKAEATSNFMEFVFRVRSANTLASTQDLYFSKFSITTEAQTGVTITKIPLASGAGTGISNNSAYGADLMNALKLDITTAAVTLESGSAIPETGTTTRTTEAANSCKTLGFESLADASLTKNITTADAVGYYNKVMGTAISAPAAWSAGTETATSGTEKVVVATLPVTDANMDFSVVEVRFVLYLDGWDNYCYDVMQGQQVNFSFQITSNASDCKLFEKASS